MLATTYISHLSQLLQEDDLRAIHDSNNNTTITTPVGAKHTGFEHPIRHSNSETTARGPQKGLLHPVKVRPNSGEMLFETSDLLANMSEDGVYCFASGENFLYC